MAKSILIADSGGTQTDWCFVNTNGERDYFTTKSYHPSNWNDDFFNEFFIYWQSKEELKKSELYFYGAGCLSKSNKTIVEGYFKNWGFQNVNIYSDVEAAFHALLGDKKGTVAILGTGSVVCDYEGNNEFKIRGGLGYILGDEGSGYYFGKLLLNSLLNNEFDSKLSNNLFNLLGDKSEIIRKVYSSEGKNFISSLAVLSKELDSPNSVIENIHLINFQSFISKYLNDKQINNDISIVGSYAFHNKSILIKCLEKNNFNLINCIQYPIISLTDYIITKYI